MLHVKGEIDDALKGQGAVPGQTSGVRERGQL